MDPKNDADWVVGLIPHLAKNEAVTVLKVGSEDIKYLYGHAEVAHASGERLWVDLAQIYDQALSKGWTVREAARSRKNSNRSGFALELCG